jgi:hypothetical protein
MAGNRSQYDVRYTPQVEELLRQLPKFEYRPLVGEYSLRGIAIVFKALPDLEFPINSAGELIEKLGGSGTTLRVVGMDVDPLRMIKYMPAHYFPLASVENFVEKMAELIRENRYQVDVPVEIENVRNQVRGLLTYPIESREALSEMLARRNRTFTFQGRRVELAEIIKRVPEDYFPIRNEPNFLSVVRNLMVNRPLIVPHEY